MTEKVEPVADEKGISEAKENLKEAVKETPVKELPKQEKEDQPEPKEMKKPVAPQPPKQPKSFTCSTDGVNDIAQCINDVVSSKHVKNALFNALNEHLKPVF